MFSQGHPEHIIPTPKEILQGEGALSLPFAVYTAEETLQPMVNAFAQAAQRIFDQSTPASNTADGVWLVYDTSLPHGTYVLDSMGEHLLLRGADSEAVAYAMASALQLVSLQDGKLTLPRCRITDAPDKEYRALMVDLAREWHASHTILRYIDVCFLLKIRYLHLHFIDDQRYTLPSRAYPLLTAKNRHYTEEDIRTWRNYANARGVILIPEFEVPGHAAMLVQQYPEVFANRMDAGQDTALVTEEGAVITDANLICAGSKDAMAAIRVLLAEICALFPESPYIHIGGDEANINAWQYCTVCRSYMQKNGISSVKELYSAFTGEVARAVLELGKTPIVWEGFPKEGVRYIPKETIVIAWESHYQMPDELLDAGFRIINGSWQPLYIVPSQKRRWGPAHILDWNVYNWQHWWPHSAACLNPIHIPPTDRVLGAQICSWECTYEQEISRIMENTAALSERVWNLRRHHDLDTFNSHLKALLSRMTRLLQDY